MNRDKTKDDINTSVQQFYNRVPFPGFDINRYNSYLDLYKNANSYARKLDYQIPYSASVVDVGCGTGQLSCLLSLKDRRVVGLDFSDASLRKARMLAEKLGLKNVRFEVADVMELSEPECSFGYIFCNGVLPCTSDPYRGFKNVIKYGESGSYVILGLYNHYGRLFLKLKQFFHNKIYRLSASGQQRATAVLHGESEADKEKDYSWFLDQYEHPLEITHTVGDVLKWFRENELDYVNSIPPIGLFKKNKNFSNIFGVIDRKISLPNLWKQYLTQLKWIISLRNTGGFFIMVGRIQ